MSKTKNSGAVLSLVGLVAFAIVLVVANYLVGQLNVRVDMTEDHLYTLSDGSKEILTNLESSVTIRYYYSRDAENIPIAMKGYARRVEDLLGEYQRASNGKLKVQRLNPLPDSDAEDSAVLDGVQGKQLTATERFYLGLAVSCVEETEAMPFLSPADENNFEYNLTRMIYRVSHPKKLVVGIMSSQDVMGQPANPMMQMQGQQGQEPWMFVTELKKDNDVREVSPTAEEIPDDMDVLVVHHPKDITDTTQYAIDQFVLRGGRLVAFLDPFSEYEQSSAQTNPMMRQPPGNSSLPALLTAWGLSFDKDQVIVDTNFSTVVPGRTGQRQSHPTVLSMDSRAVNADDPVSNSLDRLIIADAGEITGDPADGLTKTVLIHTSEDSRVVDRFRVMQKGRPGYDQDIFKEMSDTGKQRAIAVRLTGSFTSAYPKGRPGEEPAEGEEAAADHLTKSAEPGAVMIVGDSDLLMDGWWIQAANFLGQRVMTIVSDNNYLLQNGIENLSGNSALISIRSRGVTNRPFEEVAKRQKDAEDKYREEIQNLEEELQEIQQKINELTRTSTSQTQQQLIMSPEIQKELENARKKKVEANQRLKEVRKDFRREIDRLETITTWINIALVPFLIAHFGLILAVFRRRRKTSQ